MRISQYKLDNQVLKRLFALLFEVVGKRKNKEEFLNIIFYLFSPVERIMFAKRVAIAYLLLKKIDQRTISKVLKVSKATVSKFSLLLESNKTVATSFKVLLRNERIILFLAEVFLMLRPPGTPMSNWKASWDLKRAIDRKKHMGI